MPGSDMRCDLRWKIKPLSILILSEVQQKIHDFFGSLDYSSVSSYIMRIF